ncbi:MAG: hypothetical protein E3J72_22310 [Planctomycetota bacterium]|nr:MAG: hypothetical protein E3J72_22310 [Planctomycetota bacterium]
MRRGVGPPDAALSLTRMKSPLAPPPEPFDDSPNGGSPVPLVPPPPLPPVPVPPVPVPVPPPPPPLLLDLPPPLLQPE